MRYRLSIMNAVSAGALVILLLYALAHYSILTSGEGWGMVATMALFGFALAGLVVDFFLQFLIPNRKYLNIVEAVMVIGFFICMAISSH